MPGSPRSDRPTQSRGRRRSSSSRPAPAPARRPDTAPTLPAGRIAAADHPHQRIEEQRQQEQRRGHDIREPGRPPAATPVELSMYAVTVDVPSAAPATVPTASASSACRARGSVPSRSSRPDSRRRPACRPNRTARGRRRSRMTGSIGADRAPARSSCKNVGAIDGGARRAPDTWTSPSRETDRRSTPACRSAARRAPAAPIRIADDDAGRRCVEQRRRRREAAERHQRARASRRSGRPTAGR